MREEDAKSGRTTRIWVVLPTFGADDANVARAACARHLRPYLRLPSYRRMLEAATEDPERLDRAASDGVTDEQAADALGKDLIGSVSAVGDQDEVIATIWSARRAGADDVILYPLDTGSGWREAVDRTITRHAPREPRETPIPWSARSFL